MKKKGVTIDDLVVMVQKGLNDVDEKMATKGEMNKRFDLVDKRLDKIENLGLASTKRE